MPARRRRLTSPLCFYQHVSLLPSFATGRVSLQAGGAEGIGAGVLCEGWEKWRTEVERAERTAREETVFGEDGYRVDEEDGDC